MNFENRVVNYQAKFTDTEDEIVNYILQNKKNIIEIKIVTLAQLFFVAPNAITRMCHKLGYSGFAELKNEIKHELSKEDTIAENSLYTNLLRNIELIDVEREIKIVQLLLNSKKNHFFSIGQTAYAAKIIVDNFSAIDGKSFFYTYANELRHRIMNAENELFFFISLSGEKEQILELAQLAKTYQKTVISLTGVTKNRLVQLADYSIFCYSPEKFINGYNITDKTPLLITMTSLFDRYNVILNTN